MTERVYDFLLKPATEQPEDAAIEFMGKPMTYARLAERARRVSAGVSQLGVAPEASVALLLPNIPQFVEALYGAWMNGNVIVPLNVLSTAAEIRYFVQDARVRALFTLDRFLPQVEAAIAQLPDPPQVIVVGEAGDRTPYARLLEAEPRELETLHPTHNETHVLTIYTSGTTGKPKGAVITNANVVAQLDMIDSRFKPVPGDRSLCVLPLFHVFALNAVLNVGLRHHYTVVLHPKFDVAETLKSLQTEGISIFLGVPTMYIYLLKSAPAEARFPRLRYCISGGAALPVEVLREFEKRFQVPVYEGYGLTETTVSVACNSETAKRVGSVGRPYPGVEIRVVADNGQPVPTGERGEILVRGANVMSSYLERPQETEKALAGGWLHTGDIGYLDDDGFLYLVDRKRDLIIKGGYNIYPREVEDVIYQMSEVAEAAVVGVQDKVKGEQVRAVISLRPGAKLTAAAVDSFLKENLAKYKLPSEYIFMSELPKGPSGKILKRELRAEPEQAGGVSGGGRRE